MWPTAFCFSLLWILVSPIDYFFHSYNMSRTIAPGIAAVRSALTLDWLDAEDSRQRQVVQAYQTGSSPPAGIVNTDCVMYPRPAAGKIGRLLLEMLKNLEGDDGRLIVLLVQELVEKHVLVESTLLDSEPNLETLVKIPKEMLSEPYHTFPRVIGMLWLTITDPITVKQDGWCAIKKVKKYIAVTKPRYIAKHMKYLDPILARIRYIIEEFILNVAPLSLFPTRAMKTSPLTMSFKETRPEVTTLKATRKRKTTTTEATTEIIITTTTQPEPTTTLTTTSEITVEEYPENITPKDIGTEESPTEETSTKEPTTEETTQAITTIKIVTTEFIPSTTISETTTTTEASNEEKTSIETTVKRIKKTTITTDFTSPETPQWFEELPTENKPNVMFPQMDTVHVQATRNFKRKIYATKQVPVPEMLSGPTYSASVQLSVRKSLLCLSVAFFGN